MNHNNGNKATFRPILEASKTLASFSYSPEIFFKPSLFGIKKKICWNYHKAFTTWSLNIYIYLDILASQEMRCVISRNSDKTIFRILSLSLSWYNPKHRTLRITGLSHVSAHLIWISTLKGGATQTAASQKYLHGVMGVFHVSPGRRLLLFITNVVLLKQEVYVTTMEYLQVV